MKKYLHFLCISVLASVLHSCGYQTIADADYMPQQVYMPAAVNGIYVVDEIAPDNGAARYEIDLVARKLLIPLSVYRSGKDNDGPVMAKLAFSTDSVNTLISDGALSDADGVDPELLPDDMMSIPGAVNIPDGAGSGDFSMSVDLDFLMAHPRTRYVAGIELQESDRNIVGALSYIVVEINTRFIVPSVLFTCRVEDELDYVVGFSNASEYGLDYVWDFGDGSDKFVGKNPEAHKYPSNGSYDITLAARGVTGDEFKYTYNLRLWENITAQYVANYGPFKRKDSGGKTGILADWSYTENVTGANGKGGFYLESGGVMDFYNSSKDMVNAKIYQSFVLPAGAYRAAFTSHSFRGTNDCCYVVASGDGLPDIENVESDDRVLGYFRWSENIGGDQCGFEFTLESETRVTLGFVVSNSQRSRVQISNVSLYR